MSSFNKDRSERVVNGFLGIIICSFQNDKGLNLIKQRGQIERTNFVDERKEGKQSDGQSVATLNNCRRLLAFRRSTKRNVSVTHRIEHDSVPQINKKIRIDFRKSVEAICDAVIRGIN